MQGNSHHHPHHHNGVWSEELIWSNIHTVVDNITEGCALYSVLQLHSRWCQCFPFQPWSIKWITVLWYLFVYIPCSLDIFNSFVQVRCVWIPHCTGVLLVRPDWKSRHWPTCFCFLFLSSFSKSQSFCLPLRDLSSVVFPAEVFIMSRFKSFQSVPLPLPECPFSLYFVVKHS